jgi:co-chaperonin GroES (HSP10)
LPPGGFQTARISDPLSWATPTSKGTIMAKTRFLKGGDRMLFGKWSGTEVKLDDEELLIMKDIMGVLA